MYYFKVHREEKFKVAEYVLCSLKLIGNFSV